MILNSWPDVTKEVLFTDLHWCFQEDMMDTNLSRLFKTRFFHLNLIYSLPSLSWKTVQWWLLGFHHGENESIKEKEGDNIIWHHLGFTVTYLASAWDRACILPQLEHKIKVWARASTLDIEWLVLILGGKRDLNYLFGAG